MVGKPFLDGSFKSFDGAYYSLLSKISNWEEARIKYCVDNDFFINKFPITYENTFYCKIICREVGAWDTFSKVSPVKNGNNKIIYANFI